MTYEGQEPEETSYQTLNQAIIKTMEKYSSHICLKVKERGRYHTVSYRQLHTQTLRITQFLLQQGLQPGERVAIVANNSQAWLITCLGTWLAGGVVVPLTRDLATTQVYRILEDCGASIALLENPKHLKGLLNRPQEAALPSLKTIITTETIREALTEVIPLKPILTNKQPLEAETIKALQSQACSFPPQALAVISYGPSFNHEIKGAVFDHTQCLVSIEHIATWLILSQEDLGFTIRTWSEIPSLLTTLYYLLHGVANVIGSGEEALIEDMQATSPTIIFGAPAIFERFHQQCINWIDQRPELTRQGFEWAMAKGLAFRQAGSEATLELRRAYTRAYMTFFSQFRGFLGGRLQRSYSTGAVLSDELAQFFEAIGLPVLNVYSLTLAGGFPAASRFENRREGACGQISAGYDIRVAEDGEILVCSQTVMREYWQHPAETSQVLDTTGWLHTGDLGYLDDDNYLFITGRKPNAIVLSAGYKVATAAIESLLMSNPLINDVALFGNGKPFVTALIVPNLEEVATHLATNGANQVETHLDVNDSQVKTLLAEVITTVNNQLESWETIKDYILLDKPLTEENGNAGHLNNRDSDYLLDLYGSVVEGMYPNHNYLSSKDVTQMQVEAERLRELLEKESILDAWLTDAGIHFLFELAREKRIDVPSMVHICDTVAAIAQMESEEKPLSTALIVGDPIEMAQALPPGQIQLLRHDHIRRMRKIMVTLSKMVDGLVLGYLVDKHGYVRGIHRLTLPDSIIKPTHFLLGPNFSRHAAISQVCDALVFFVPSGGRQARVFADGQLIGRYANGDWSPENVGQVDEVVQQLVSENNYNQVLIERILRCAFEMSEENLGAIFVIGDADVILERSDASEISAFTHILSTPVSQLSNRELINFAKQDGATVIDRQGMFRGCMVLLRPDATTRAEIGPGKGARHSSAAKMSAEANCLAITVSQDGPITLYESGRRVLSL